MTSSERLIEILYFNAGIKNIVVGFDGNDRPAWLPDPNLVGLHSDIRPQKDDFIIEYSRYKREASYITWIGVYTHGVDEVYGNRSNFTGIGIWLRNYIPTDPESFIDALIKILKRILETTVQDGKQQSERLLQDGFIDSWAIRCESLPNLHDGIPFNTTTHSDTIYIDAGTSDIAHAFNDISTNILINSFKAEPTLKSYSRLLFLLVSKETLRTVNANKVIRLTTRNAAHVIADYFFDGLQHLKDEINNSKEIETKNINIIRKYQEEVTSQRKTITDAKSEVDSIITERNNLISKLQEQDQVIINNKNYINKLRAASDITSLRHMLSEINADNNLIDALSKAESKPFGLIANTANQYPGRVFSGGDNKQYNQRELEEISRALRELQDYIYSFNRKDDRSNSVTLQMQKISHDVTNVTNKINNILYDTRRYFIVVIAAIAVLLISGPLFNYFIYRVGYENIQSSNKKLITNLENTIKNTYKDNATINDSKQGVPDGDYEKNQDENIRVLPNQSPRIKRKSPQ